MQKSDPTVLSILLKPLHRVQNAIRGRRRIYLNSPEAGRIRQEEYERRRPASLSTVERRPLTPSPSDPELECLGQEESPFFQKLPPEIRRLVYEHALGQDILHILLQTGKLSHICCYEPGKKDWWRHTCLGPAWETDGTFVGRKKDGSGIADGDKLPLLQTCRLVYAEAIDLMYSANTFDIQDLDRLFDLARTSLPQRMEMIGSLQLRYFHSSVTHNRADDSEAWEAAVQILAGMSSLRRLRIEISTEKSAVLPPIPVHVREQKLLRPLMALNQVKDFVVEVNWPADNDSISEEGLPFVVVRPSGDVNFTPNGLYRI